ncbi:pentatricopeptide repeat-containing protein At2g17210 [Punica granatum]|uniref:Pentatricopeptide repeat-containing protein At2g17210 n=1 Tax=Punica granatum TaxID=22663 RepID=A0A218X7Z8_PUNGR|nr:pentatricopeptide repeat-containing protein At2g17210 [Punica granatum]OWM80502.1 hypothetical protein CDL15_Pgr019782 [Punica granatum]
MVANIPNRISWIKELSSGGKWFEVFSHYNELRRAGLQVTDPSAFSSIIKACSKLSSSHGESVQACVIKLGLASVSSVANSGLDFYVKCRDYRSAMTVFRSMENRDSISWNILVHGFLDMGDWGEGLRWFRNARAANFEPNISTLVLLIQACRRARFEHEALGVHGYIMKSGFQYVPSVQNSLLGMYAGIDMEGAKKLFDEMPERDAISWSVIIGGYVNSKEAEIALRIFQEMVSEANVRPDEVTIASVVKACANFGILMLGRAVHGFVTCNGLDADIFVENSLIDMYSKCKDVDSAVQVFWELSQKDLVSWNAMLSGLVLNEKYQEALLMFSSMAKGGVEFDEVTLVNILQICKSYAHRSWCKSIHGVVIRGGYEMNELLLNCLIDAYGKCGHVNIAQKLFSGLKRRDVVSWSALIAGFAHSGKPDEAIRVFDEMIWAAEKPNGVTMVNLLEACALSGELNRSKSAHGIAVRRGLADEVAVGSAILDMYSKSGAIECSRRVFDQMPHKNIVTWSAMIAGYGMNGLAREALALLAQLREQGMKPNAVTALSVLSACSHGGLVEEGISLFEWMVQEDGLIRSPEHYACIADMLSRAGSPGRAIDLIESMPPGIKPTASAWAAIMSACKSSGNAEIGERAVPRVLELEPLCSTNYMLASGMFAAGGKRSEAAWVRRLVKERGVKVIAGYSLVYVENRACRFVAWDKTHPFAGEISRVVEQLHLSMRFESRSGKSVGIDSYGQPWDELSC